MKETEINYEEGAFEFTQRLFGRQPADDDLARLAGALDGATVNVSVKKKKGWLYLTVNDARFERYETSIRLSGAAARSGGNGRVTLAR